MHQVQLELTDQLYDQAKRRAVEAGFKSVNEYIADVVSDDLTEQTENFDHLFTPERLAIIDKAAAQIKAGEYQTATQVREHFRKRFEG